MSLWEKRERVYPYVFGVAGGVGAFFFGADVAGWAEASGVETKEFFAAIFDISSIMTPFLFAFFGIVVAAPTGSFISELSGTRTFRLFLRYIAEAMVLGATLTFASLPFMVAGVVPKVDHPMATTWTVFWAFICVSAFFAFFRVAKVFLIWVIEGSRSFRHARA